MIRIHHEGRTLLMALFLIFAVFNGAIWYGAPAAFPLALIATLVIYGIVLQFFRNPKREIAPNESIVTAPADGKVVVIEEILEKEYFKERRLLVSIFMSPFNVHVNRNPVSGTVTYFRYHKGKYLVAWHPKSSEENERTTVVYDTGRHQLLMRQIAGAMAKRIKWYVKEGQTVTQGAEMGFIKFGSRVDLYLPLSAQTAVKLGQTVYGNETVIAQLP